MNIGAAMLKLYRKGNYYTNCVAKVCECVGFESPLTPTLSPLDKLVRVHRFGTESLRQGRFSPADAWAGRRAVLPSPPVSPPPAGRERGIVECGSEASAHAEAGASALQRVGRAAPLSHSVGERLGVRAKKRALPAHSKLKRCSLTMAGEGDYGVRKRSFRPR